MIIMNDAQDIIDKLCDDTRQINADISYIISKLRVELEDQTTLNTLCGLICKIKDAEFYRGQAVGKKYG